MADNRSKLEKLIGMLGSDHEGEQLNALRFIKKIAADEKKTLTQLLMSGPERIVYVDKIIYRDNPQPQQPPYRRNYSGSRFDEEQPRQRKHSSRFEERDGSARVVLDALTEAAEKGADILSWSDLDAARDMAYSYNYDEDLSPAQLKYARSIVKRYKRGSAEAVV